MTDKELLLQIIRRIDGKGYKAYNRLKGSYNFDDFILYIEHVQRDPFARASLIRIEIEHVPFPYALFETIVRRVALEDYVCRCFSRAIKKYVSGKMGSGNSGIFHIDQGGQEVLERSSVNISPSRLELRFNMGLPAQGRRVSGKNAEQMFFYILPKIVAEIRFINDLSSDEMENYVETVEDAEHIRSELNNLGLVAFIADESILPRESGISEPLKNAVPLKSPESLKMTIKTPNRGCVTGMGLPEGVTLILGGGYHGKSTLLKSIERGVYNHKPGDGRELVITIPQAVKIRAEDGRKIEKVDISAFIHSPPTQQDTTQFSTENASGSTSQAANIIEALEVGAKLLLFDEDTSATNFMIRDERMQKLVSKEKEPITPFIDRIQELCQDQGVSTIIVMGGSGDYFEVADNIIMMDSYLPYDVTSKARNIAQKVPTGRVKEVGKKFSFKNRYPLKDSVKPFKGKKLKLDGRGMSMVIIGHEHIDLSQIEQLVDSSQIRTISYAIHYIYHHYLNRKNNMADALQLTMDDIEKYGLDVLAPPGRPNPPNIAQIRIFELAAAINRLRTLKVRY